MCPRPHAHDNSLDSLTVTTQSNIEHHHAQCHGHATIIAQSGWWELIIAHAHLQQWLYELDYRNAR